MTAQAVNATTTVTIYRDVLNYVNGRFIFDNKWLTGTHFSNYKFLFHLKELALLLGFKFHDMFIIDTKDLRKWRNTRALGNFEEWEYTSEKTLDLVTPWTETHSKSIPSERNKRKHHGLSFYVIIERYVEILLFDIITDITFPMTSMAFYDIDWLDTIQSHKNIWSSQSQIPIEMGMAIIITNKKISSVCSKSMV